MTPLSLSSVVDEIVQQICEAVALLFSNDSSYEFRLDGLVVRTYISTLLGLVRCTVMYVRLFVGVSDDGMARMLPSAQGFWRTTWKLPSAGRVPVLLFTFLSASFSRFPCGRPPCSITAPKCMFQLPADSLSLDILKLSIVIHAICS